MEAIREPAAREAAIRELIAVHTGPVKRVPLVWEFQRMRLFDHRAVRGTITRIATTRIERDMGYARNDALPLKVMTLTDYLPYEWSVNRPIQVLDGREITHMVLGQVAPFDVAHLVFPGTIDGEPFAFTALGLLRAIHGGPRGRVIHVDNTYLTAGRREMVEDLGLTTVFDCLDVV